jgi:hypothetical protein
LPTLIQRLSDEYKECSLRFVSIHEDGGGAVVELAIEETDNLSAEQIKQLQTALTVEAQQLIETRRLALTERETRLQLEGEVKQLNIMVNKLLDRPGININNKGNLNMLDDKGDTYNIYGQSAATGRHALAHDNTFNQHVTHFEQSTDFSALAKELSELRQAITKQDSSPQTAIALGKVAEAELAAAEKDTSRVIEHLKSAGKWTLDFARDIGKDVVAEAIRQAMGMG